MSKAEFICIDQLRLKAEQNTYFDPEKLVFDIVKLISWNQLYRARSINSYKYLSGLYEFVIHLINKKSFFRKFYTLKMDDFNRLLTTEQIFKVKDAKWPVIPTDFREYEELDDYNPTPQNRREIINNRLKS